MEGNALPQLGEGSSTCSRRIGRILPIPLGTVVDFFESDFYIDADDVRSSVLTQRPFNLMHLKSRIKVDFIIRKSAEYRQVEFARRKQVNLAGVTTWIATREDLILSKLVWAKDSASELQQRDVRSLIEEGRP